MRLALAETWSSMRTILHLLATIGVCSLAGCADERYFVMTEEWLVESNGERHVGGGCTAVAKGMRGGTGGGSADVGEPLRFAVEFESLGDGVRVAVVGSTERVERFFDERWLRGERPAETIEVAAAASASYRVRLWGGLRCVPPRGVDAGASGP
ncbi:MAG: hypothetical protein KC657_38150 [Myxococcales bacterium]|nr:hypothetical protein [Myxococcales bacterium]